MARVVVVASYLLTLVLAWGCGSKDGNGKPAGSEGGACYGNGTCDGGLDCRYGVCVNPSVPVDVIQETNTGDDANSGDQKDPGGGGCGSHCEEMVTVPAGTFWQGCNPAVATWCGSAVVPYHEVNVPAFEMDKYEVTVELYARCVKASACTAPSTDSTYCNWNKAGKAQHPVNCITWYQAGEYCSWAGKRLCSESEWEKASRGTDGRDYPWGNEKATCEYAVLTDGVHADGDHGCLMDSTWPVGSKPAGASPYGALDMIGNVHEWLEDDSHDSYTGAPTNGSAWVENPRASYREIRGGYFADHGNSQALKLWSRGMAEPADSILAVGARCCRSLQP